MAQQHTTPAGTPAAEPNQVFWSRQYIKALHQIDRLKKLAARESTSEEDRMAIIGGIIALDEAADKQLAYAKASGGLLFCWQGSALEGDAA